MTIHYLTVQDILWIHRQITRQEPAFDFAHLEEATFEQYAYGSSADPLAQAEKFLRGFIDKPPFREANEAVGTIACAAFLELNGYRLALPTENLSNWLSDTPVANRAEPLKDAHGGSVREIAKRLVADHAGLWQPAATTS